MNNYKNVFLVILASTLIACSGGGGGSGEPAAASGGSPSAATSFGSALAFEYPDPFLNGDAYSTAAGFIRIQGELNSVAIPRGYCPDQTPPQNYSLRWTNAATGEAGTAPIGIGCVQNLLFGITLNGIASSFLVYPVELVLGENAITFETYSGSKKIGEDTIRIIREDRTPPAAVFHYPGTDAVDIPVNHALVVQFDEPMDADSLTPDRFLLNDSLGNPVAGEHRYERETLTFLFKPDNSLNPEEIYSARLAGDVQDTSGNPLEDELSWSFTTGPAEDTTPLQFESRWPDSGCDCASPSTRILTRFDQVSDPASIASDSMTVRDEAGALLPGEVRYAGDFIEFHPVDSLGRGRTYTVTIKAGIRDLAGLALARDQDWQFTTTAHAPGGTWHDTATSYEVAAMSHHSAIWTGTEVLFWGWEGGARYDPPLDRWFSLSMADAPRPRGDHSATWTGSAMIVWGGRGEDGSHNNGGIYDPVNDTWQAIFSPLDPAVGATHNHVAAWTGSELIVWGGINQSAADDPGRASNRGFRFDPLTDSWAEIAAGPLSPRHATAFVWTGDELIIWGGKTIDGEPFSDGARYDPASDTWTILPAIDAPQTSRSSISAIWTGTEVIVWNGGRTDPDQLLNDAYRQTTMRLYDPVTDSWRVPDSGWEPFVATGDQSTFLFATGYSAHWTGDEMFVLGKAFADGAWFFDPVSESWRPASKDNAPVSIQESAVLWAGDRFVEWGGVLSVLPRREGKYYLPE